MGLIGFTDTKRQALKLKKDNAWLFTNIKILTRTAAFGKIIGYEVEGKVKPSFKQTVKRGNKKITTTYVMHKGKKIRVMSEVRGI